MGWGNGERDRRRKEKRAPIVRKAGTPRYESNQQVEKSPKDMSQAASSSQLKVAEARLTVGVQESSAAGSKRVGVQIRRNFRTKTTRSVGARQKEHERAAMIPLLSQLHQSPRKSHFPPLMRTRKMRTRRTEKVVLTIHPRL